MIRTALATKGVLYTSSAARGYLAVHPIGPFLLNACASLLFWTLTTVAICRIYSIIVHLPS